MAHILKFRQCLPCERYNGSAAVTCPCTCAMDRFSQADYRSVLALTSLTNTRADQSERHVRPAPIWMPDWSSCQGGQRRNLFAQPRTEHERHFGTPFRRPSRNLDLGERAMAKEFLSEYQSIPSLESTPGRVQIYRNVSVLHQS